MKCIHGVFLPVIEAMRIEALGAAIQIHRAEAFPARMIADWFGFADHPGYAELDRLGIAWPEDEDSSRALEELAACEGDKLGGWPAWSQEADYPLCPRCQTEMALLFQIDSADNVPHLFGEGGIGHLTQCLQHREVLAFGWGGG